MLQPRSALLHIILLLKNFIKNHKLLAQYLVSLVTTKFAKIQETIVKAVNSPQINNERTFHVDLVAERFCIVSQKYFLRQGFSLSLNFL